MGLVSRAGRGREATGSRGEGLHSAGTDKNCAFAGQKADGFDRKTA